MKLILRIAAVLPIFALGAWAQESGAKLNDEAVAKVKMRLEGTVMSQPIKNAPYSAEEVTSSTQVLADGTRIHHENKVAVYRDSEGRVRRETSPDQITIMDPVAGVSYFLNPQTMTAHKAPVMNMAYSYVRTGSPGVMMGAARPEGTFTVSTNNGVTSMSVNGTPMDPKALAEALDKAKRNGESVAVNAPLGPPQDMIVMEKMAAEKMAMSGGFGPAGGGHIAFVSNPKMAGKTEELGTQTMEGVSAEGKRTTSTIEAGAIGNDRPIQIVNETWYSPELQMMVMNKMSDPRMGETSFQLNNVRRAEPASYLFQVPAGYTVAERK